MARVLADHPDDIVMLGREAHRLHRGDTSMNKVTPFLMCDDQLEAAIEFYTATFPNSEVRNVARTGKDGPISSAEFVVGGQLFMGYNGGPYFSFSEGVSLYVDCADQDEVDEYWDKLVKAGSREPTTRRSRARPSRARAFHECRPTPAARPTAFSDG
jgi:predicted 3-demethylubiquinone-9 3-methyltransferase (glyoxalase superfamily)